MATWKKIITSGSAAELSSLTLDTQLPVAQGGTGATTLTDGGVLLGSGTGAITAMGVLSNGQMIVGDGTTDPVAESGATLRTSIGVGTGDSPQFTDLTLTGGDITLTGAATDIDLIDNNTSALSFDASGKAGILEIVTTDNAEKVKMSGDLDVAGIISGSTISGSFVGDGSGLTGVGTDIDGLGNYGAQTLHQSQDHFLVSDNGTEKKINFSDLEDSIFANVSGDATIAGGGALTIAATAVENGMLADNAVDTEEIADNAVSLAKMAGLARGKIIVGDSSGDPSALSPGGANTVLQSDGTDITYNTVATAMIADNAVSLAKMAGLARGKIIVGDASGDPSALAAGANGKLLVADANGDPSWTTVSGDATLSAGALTISDNKIGNSELKQDDDITLQSLTLTGDLTVNGTTTTIATANTKVEDKFMFLATGSATSNTDAGIMVQSGSVDLSGSAFYHDVNVVAGTNPNGGRWSVAKSVGHDVGAVTPLQFVSTVKTDTVNPDTTSGSYGAGEMHVNTSTGDIWIRFG